MASSTYTNSLGYVYDRNTGALVSKPGQTSASTSKTSSTTSSSGSTSKTTSSSSSKTSSSSSKAYSSQEELMSTDWQSKINDAVARGDMAAAAQYESARNDKINSGSYTGKQTTTNNYQGYAPGSQPQYNQNSTIYDVGPDKTRRPDLAGQSIKVGEYTVTYNNAGYFQKAVKDNGASATGADSGKVAALNQLAASNPTIQQVIAAAQQGNWNLAGSIANGLHTPVTGGAGEGDTGYDTKFRDQVWSLITDVYGYDKDAYVDKLVADAENGGAPATVAGTPATGTPNAGGTAAGVSGTGTGSGSFNANVNISGSGGNANVAAPNLRDYLDQWLAASQSQIQNSVDFATQQGINELTRAEEDAQEQFQTQRNQIAVDEAKAKDNQALYAEARGDKGGIGAAQYDSIMNTAAQNRQAVSTAQTKLATDTARQIADLRAQGEFEKADKLLQLSQTYLSQLMSLEQWSLEYGLSVAQFQAQLDQWAKEFDLQVGDMLGVYNGMPTMSAQKFQYEMDADARQQQAGLAETLLGLGIMPSPDQLAALGISESQAQDIMTAQQAAAAAKKGNGGNGGGGSPVVGQNYDGLMAAALASKDPKSFIRNNAEAYGFKDTEGAVKELYDLFMRDYNASVDTVDRDHILNQNSDYGIYLDSKFGTEASYSSWSELMRLADNGEIKFVFDHEDEGEYYYRVELVN